MGVNISNRSSRDDPIDSLGKVRNFLGLWVHVRDQVTETQIIQLHFYGSML